jgi:hypothetical protein
VRPRYAAYVAHDTDCRYGETEARQIRHRYDGLKGKRTVQEELYDMLPIITKRDAADAFRRTQSGANANALVRQVQESSLVLGLLATFSGSDFDRSSSIAQLEVSMGGYGRLCAQFVRNNLPLAAASIIITVATRSSHFFVPDTKKLRAKIASLWSPKG